MRAPPPAIGGQRLPVQHHSFQQPHLLRAQPKSCASRRICLMRCNRAEEAAETFLGRAFRCARRIDTSCKPITDSSVLGPQPPNLRAAEAQWQQCRKAIAKNARFLSDE